MILSLEAPIRYLQGVGPKREKLFGRIGLCTAEDLLHHFPRRYEDRSRLFPIAQLKPGEPAAVRVKILRVGGRVGWRRGLDILRADVEDPSGRIGVVWFNQPYLRKYILAGGEVVLFGTPRLYKDRLQFVAPDFECLSDHDDDVSSSCRILPVYPLTERLTQSFFRKTVHAALKICVSSLKEVLPFDIRRRHNLVNIARSLQQIHFPESDVLRFEAYRRLSFEEFFLHQIPLVLRKLKRRQKRGIAFAVDRKLLEDFEESLAFSLTASQKKAVEEILCDMASPRPMQRLLEGDVGSGKTVVASMAALAAVGGGFQAAFMVPTEILANQHFEKLKAQFSIFQAQKIEGGYQREAGRRRRGIRMGLLTGSFDKKERRRLLEQIQRGDIDIVIGTHALLQEDVSFSRLGLIVIDEQHKFGVSQRALLAAKGICPDILIMTATPIPRTLSLTLYGDLDISVIDELPLGRKKIKTFCFDVEARLSAYEAIRGRLAAGERGYVVCPLIEEDGRADGVSAKKVFHELSRGVLAGFRLGLIHGRLKKEDQECLMSQFRGGELDALVTTSLLEVGIDVPEASVILIDGAERFGLAQLHQMRGRVGRGEKESFCYLVSSSLDDGVRQRLELFAQCADGFRIAEEDMRLRGPGEFFGERQHGLSRLKIADPLAQLHLLKAAREEAWRLAKCDPTLSMRPHQELRRRLAKMFPEFEKFIMVG